MSVLEELPLWDFTAGLARVCCIYVMSAVADDFLAVLMLAIPIGVPLKPEKGGQG